MFRNFHPRFTAVLLTDTNPHLAQWFLSSNKPRQAGSQTVRVPLTGAPSAPDRGGSLADCLRLKPGQISTGSPLFSPRRRAGVSHLTVAAAHAFPSAPPSSAVSVTLVLRSSGFSAPSSLRHNFQTLILKKKSPWTQLLSSRPTGGGAWLWAFRDTQKS